MEIENLLQQQAFHVTLIRNIVRIFVFRKTKQAFKEMNIHGKAKQK